MAFAVIMPRQGQSVESCLLTQWYKNVGDQVSKGDLLFAYETDKAAFEEEARDDGILLARFFGEGDEVPVLSNLAVIGQAGEEVEAFRPQGRTEGNPPEAASPEQNVAEDRILPGASGNSGPGIHAVPSGGRISISPRARKLASEKRIVTAGITGTGPGGRILERDILDEIRRGKRLTPLARKKLEGEGLTIPASGTRPYGKISARELEEAPADGDDGFVTGAYSDEPLSKIRKIIAATMHRSLQNSAQLTHHMGANATQMLLLRAEVKKRMKEAYGHNITLNDMVCFAVIRALLLHPDVNAHYLDGIIRRFRHVNLGLAVDTDRGLLVPTLEHAESLSLADLSDRLSGLADASRSGSISPDLLSPGSASFTVSNLGNYGVEIFTPVINLPQVAILGVNTILQRPVVLKDGTFGFQPFLGLSLTYDHRAVDGGPATLFLAEIRKQIESLSPDLIT
jgi:pyruvate dehydrogenase E2 component (dihydrolipoamide acetyltransferase)